ncbi:hypothetical protein UFOVP903_44 [uncultured Caudovirales phage]|uniref:Uncharacterized protein n=1 Tax=uncultured Caudovirales phage TaxID=2100421 RepID=A0A6J5PLG5_9CAUD|nr:hypothetical protein UFOVP903_44 [uncultured Caudovirales phage]CAB4197224.1 hypothetical protein UFOVP1318_2 [uncultured Caudovirales phage]CAB4210754.1 hypothetical protein UFOVP1430_42 [uncultured Caudovirales phage]
METLTLLGSALTIIGSLVGGGLWLMKANFKLSQQTLAAKKDLYQERFENLKGALATLEDRLRTYESSATETSRRLTIATSKLEQAEIQLARYSAATEKKIESFESVIVKLSNDLIMIKNKPKGDQ